ncbi:MAG TPA: substrate-binding domain-containing protein [Gemmataceae bacterium]|jgi:ribose transport system substrate-binding protein|nr:substrate-binding domain-containing protein [Gemmataceae bacterium]
MPLSRRSLLFAASMAVFAFLPSCNRGGDSGKIKVAFVTNNPEDFWTIAEKGAKDAADKHGVELIFRKPDKGDTGIQRDIVNELVAKGVQGIAVSVINPEEQTPDLKQVATKTNLLTVDNDATASGRLCYIGTDNYEAGKAVGRLVKEVMPQGGTVAIFVGQITPINARQRFQGVVDELAGQKDAKGPTIGKYTLYKNEAITDGAQRATCLDNAKDAIEKLTGTENVCMVGLWAYNAPAILEAAKSKNAAARIKIVSFDEYPDTLTAIDKGEIYATVVQDPYNFGYKSVELMAEMAKSGDKSVATNKPLQNIDYRVVVKEAAKDPVTGKDRLAARDFQKELNKLMGK